MTRHCRILLSAFCIVTAVTSSAFGQVRKYTQSFEKDRQNDSKVVELLQRLQTSNSKLNTEDLLNQLNH